MTEGAATVGVIMTCYNEGPWIGDAVRSVLDQTWADRVSQIVIADDGSDLATCAVLKSIEGWDARIQVIYGPGKAGPSAQRNIAASHITAPILAILDGDDLWTPDKLERQLAAMADVDIGLLYSGYHLFPDGHQDRALRGAVRDITRSNDLMRAYFLDDPPIIPSTALVRRSAFDQIGGFDPAIKVFEDTDFCIRLAGVCRFGLVDAALVYKRLRSSSTTGGRHDLMAHHAFVALKAAAVRSDLLALVPRRLSERARKLGNQCYLSGDAKGAVRLLRFAIQLDGWNIKAWASLAVAVAGRGLMGRLLDPILSQRRRMMGAAPL